MVSFSTTGLLLPVALFPLGTTHDCAIGQAGPSIWSRLPPAIPTRGAHAADRARGHARSHSCAARGRGAAGEGVYDWAPLSSAGCVCSRVRGEPSTAWLRSRRERSLRDAAFDGLQG